MKLHADAKHDAKLQDTIRYWWQDVNRFLEHNYEAIEWDTYDAPKPLTLTQLKERGWGWTDKGNLVLSADKILGEKFYIMLEPAGAKHGFLAEHKYLKAPMLFFSILKKPFSTVGLASRLPHNLFAHEVTHYLDELRTKGHKQYSGKKFDAGDLDAYFNDPYEYNAYYQEALTTIQSLLEMDEISLQAKRNLLGSFDTFKSHILDKLGPVLLKHLEDRFKKKLFKRLYGFWSHYKKKLGGSMSFAAKVQAKYIVAEQDEHDEEEQEGARFGYYINLDERGEFYADVRNEDGETVYEVKNDEETGEIPEVEDGYMKHARDIGGLEKHLKQLSVIPKDAELMSSKDFEKA